MLIKYLLSTVRVDVKKESYISLVANNLLLKVVNLRMQGFTGKYPLSVYVISWDVGSVVATYHSVDIDHGNDSELKLLSERFSFESVTEQKVEKSLHDKRTGTFARMLSGNDINDRFLSFHEKDVVGNTYQVDIISHGRFA